MNTQTRKLPVLIVLICLTIPILLTLACSSLTTAHGEISQVVDITLDEQMFNYSSPTFKVDNHDFWEDLDVHINRLELHDGFLRFLGTRILPDGSTTDCSIDVSLGAENGILTARIIAVDIPGLELSDPVVVEINQELEASLSLDGFDPHAALLFKEVEVTEGALRIKVQVDIRF